MVLSKTSTKSNQTIHLDDDQYLIRAILEGNQNAFGELFLRYHQQVYSYLMYILQDDIGAEDVLQEVFLAVWQGASNFKYKSSVKTWIYRIAYKKSISWLRRNTRKLSPIQLEDLVDISTGPEEEAISAIRNAQLRRAMVSLSPKHRAVLELVFVQDMSCHEIADILNCPIGTVKSRMSYALRNLNQILLKTGIDHWEDTGEEMRK